jgi:hypothetical protein
MKKIVFALALLTGLLFGFGKPEAAKFKLSFSTYNHAEGIDTMIYHYSLEGNELIMNVVYMHADSRSEDQYTTTLMPEAIARLQAIKLDGLENEYVNHCIATGYGRE